MRKKVNKDSKVSSKPKPTVSLSKSKPKPKPKPKPQPQPKPKPRPVKTLADALNYLKVSRRDVARVHEFEDRFLIDLKVGGRQVVEKTK